ncbi:MAG: hypothetical protein NTV52_24695 [Acidobacteria bacterium]|nr:hypothetical protein [Acidobacteriota bacterium]
MVLLVVGDDRSGLGEEARAFGGVGAVGFEDSVVNGLEFGLLGGREVDVATVDEVFDAGRIVAGELENGYDGAAEFGGIERRGFRSGSVGTDVEFVVEEELVEAK